MASRSKGSTFHRTVEDILERDTYMEGVCKEFQIMI